MKKTTVTCDQCGDIIRDRVFNYGANPMPGTAYSSYEGQRFNWEFCSQGCLVTWLMARSKERWRL